MQHMNHLPALRRLLNFKNPLISGTLIMTGAGILTRVIGFFYRIFLSRTIGEQSLGIYQLLAPIFALCFALTASAIQTTISKFVGDAVGGAASQSSTHHAPCSGTPRSNAHTTPCPGVSRANAPCSKTSRADTHTVNSGEHRARTFLAIGLMISCALSLLLGIFIYQNAPDLAALILGSPQYAPLLVLLTYSLLPSAIHACINGYYYGKKHAFVPSLCQLVEQLARVGSVYLFYQISLQEHTTLTADHAVLGLVIGECFGLLVSLTAFCMQKDPGRNSSISDTRQYSPKGSPTKGTSCPGITVPALTCAMLAMILPLTANRLLLTVSTSLENLLIPRALTAYGYTHADALGLYGILSGMTMPIILFPCVLTNSFSVLLLPTISEEKASGDTGRITSAVRRSLSLGATLGLLFTVCFLLGGHWIGNRMFHNALAGAFICSLSFLCPLLYITSLLGSILHGLGMAGSVLWINLLACAIRIGMILLFVPQCGIHAYLWGMLVGQVFAVLGSMWVLREYLI